VLFGLIRVFTGHAPPDAARLTFYRPGFYGAAAKELTHEVMRGPSAWSVADRELMAAFVSTVNGSPFCIGAHTATAGQAYRDPAKVAAVLADPNSAPLDEGLRATLSLLGTLTREGKVDAEAMRAVLATGVTRRQIEEALAVCAVFNTINRLADAFDFELLDPEGFDAGATYLLKRGYR
jgi:uncharacterized peroxidase-related enzyme